VRGRAGGETLNARERAVLMHIAGDENTGIIAIKLGISEQAVEEHRASLIKKDRPPVAGRTDQVGRAARADPKTSIKLSTVQIPSNRLPGLSASPPARGILAVSRIQPRKARTQRRFVGNHQNVRSQFLTE
jgi:hypothetical protein